MLQLTVNFDRLLDLFPDVSPVEWAGDTCVTCADAMVRCRSVWEVLRPLPGLEGLLFVP